MRTLVWRISCWYAESFVQQRSRWFWTSLLNEMWVFKFATSSCGNVWTVDLRGFSLVPCTVLKLGELWTVCVTLWTWLFLLQQTLLRGSWSLICHTLGFQLTFPCQGMFSHNVVGCRCCTFSIFIYCNIFSSTGLRIFFRKLWKWIKELNDVL